MNIALVAIRLACACFIALLGCQGLSAVELSSETLYDKSKILNVFDRDSQRRLAAVAPSDS